MISRIQAKGYRCLRYVDQHLRGFHVLVGPNASGKTTFLDVPGFLGDLLSDGLDAAVLKRSTNFFDLTYLRGGDGFEIALECTIPEEQKAKLPNGGFDTVRYEIKIVFADNEVRITDEQLILLTDSEPPPVRQMTLFPSPPEPIATLMSPPRVRAGKRIMRKVRGGNDNFYSEIALKKGQGGWVPSFRLGARKSALGNMPEDEQNFPVATWLRETLKHGTQSIVLNSLKLRQSSPPGRGNTFLPDGSNLPWVVEKLKREDTLRFAQWLGHLGTALPDLTSVESVELPDTRHRYLALKYGETLTVPSWMASDGTLRMLALTLPAYLASFKGVYLIEEPENGVHPQAMETVFQSLSSVYTAQMLVATHSPVILGCARPEDVLCFKKTAEGATDIVQGDAHPALSDWQGETDLSVLFASGVLG